MAFCWFTSSIGYPDFFASSGRGADLANSFLRLAGAARAGTSYADSKLLFTDLDPHQVETKKAAFQEFGLLYVVPRSNKIALTPLGMEVLTFCSDKKKTEANRRFIALALARGLARYQFSNPLPVGGNRETARAASSDVRPYLICFYLLHKLDGFLTASEFRGAIFALQFSRDVGKMEALIDKSREAGTMLPAHPGLPANAGTAENLKIYFLSHLGLSWLILKDSENDKIYRANDQVFELTQFGYEITESVLESEWPRWRDARSHVPKAISYSSIQTYFEDGVGQACPLSLLISDSTKAETEATDAAEGVIEKDALEGIKDLPHREYEDGRAKLILHARLERYRNPALVRDAKAAFKKKHGRLFCESCAFDFEVKYGKRGKDYIEAHHRKPISEGDPTKATRLTIADLGMVCSNCHRMLHRTPWITLEDLKELLVVRKSAKAGV